MSGRRVPRMRAALCEAKRIGLHIEPVRRTGEMRIGFPDGGRGIRVNVRRNDAGRDLMSMIERQQRTRRRG